MSTPPNALETSNAAAREQPTGSLVLECPYQFALEVRVVDAEGKPVRAMPVEVRQGEGEAIRTKTDSEGVARYEGLLEKSYPFSLYTQYPDGWALVKSEALATPKTANGAAKWAALPKPVNADFAYEAKEGECVNKIGARFGVPAQTVWDLNVSLHEKRPSMHHLVPGDVLTVPGVQPKYVDGQAGYRHEVKLQAAPALLRVQFLDKDGEPRTEVPYLVEFTSNPPVESREGETDGAGFLEEVVPPEATKATVLLAGFEGQEEYELAISHLEPVSTTRGVQARLRNLGYGGGEEDGEMGPQTAAALRLFQWDYELPVNGEADEATRAKLVEAHHS